MSFTKYFPKLKNYSSYIFLFLATLICFAISFDFVFDDWFEYGLGLHTDATYFLLLPVGFLSILFFIPVIAIGWFRINRKLDNSSLGKIFKWGCFVFTLFSLVWPIYMFLSEISYLLEVLKQSGSLYVLWSYFSVDTLINLSFYSPYFLVAFLFVLSGRRIKDSELIAKI